MDGLLIPVIIVVCIGFVAGVILTIASKVMSVPVDEKVEELIEAMPGANCGACGFAGCENYAVTLAEDKEHVLSTSLCPVGGGNLSNTLANILGVEATSNEPRVAIVTCGGSSKKTKRIMIHDKKWSCKAASNLYGGQMACSDGCLGLGDCLRICPYNAISMKDMLATVDRNLCIGCGLCATICPKNTIKIFPENTLTYVSCQSKAPGGETRKACKVGCIGCTKCAKVCQRDAITIDNNHAIVDPTLCTNCGDCVRACPTSAIIRLIKEIVPAKKRRGFFKNKKGN